MSGLMPEVTVGVNLKVGEEMNQQIENFQNAYTILHKKHISKDKVVLFILGEAGEVWENAMEQLNNAINVKNNE